MVASTKRMEAGEKALVAEEVGVEVEVGEAVGGREEGTGEEG